MFALTWTNADGTFDVVEFDTVDTEDHTLDNDVTEFPVEQGPDITDNIRVKPRVLSVKGYISDTPLYQNPDVVIQAEYVSTRLDLPPSIHYEPKTVTLDVPGSPIRPNASGLVNAALGALFGSTPKATPLMAKGTDAAPSTTVQSMQITPFQSRVRQTWDLLKKASGRGPDGDKPLIRCVTDFDEIDGLAVTSLTMPRATDDGNGAVIGFDLKQIVIAQSQTTTAPVPAEGLGQARKFVGSKAAKDDANAADKANTTAKSLAKQLGGSLLSVISELIGGTPS